MVIAARSQKGRWALLRRVGFPTLPQNCSSGRGRSTFQDRSSDLMGGQKSRHRR
jgi:hypothetical protein